MRNERQLGLVQSKFTRLGSGEPVLDSRAVFPSRDRFDPLYESEPDTYTRSSWVRSGGTSEMGVVLPSGLVQVVDKRDTIFPVLNDSFLYSQNVVKVMDAALNLGVFTTDQMVSLVGRKSDGKEKWSVEHILHKLYLGGFIMKLDDDIDVWSFDWVSRKAPAYFNRLPADLKILTTGGKNLLFGPPGINSPFTIRHDLITNELMIRSMEVSDHVAGFWGPTFMDAKSLYFGSDDEVAFGAQGDGGIVTKNGRIIVLETVGGSVTGANWERTRKKAAAWSAVAGMSRNDISVIFVCLNAERDHNNIKKAVFIGQKTAGEYTSSSAAITRGRRKIGVVMLENLMPEKGLSGSDLRELVSWNPWHSETFNAFTAPPDDATRHVDLINPAFNTVASLHTPYWLFDERKNLDGYGL